MMTRATFLRLGALLGASLWLTPAHFLAPASAEPAGRRAVRGLWVWKTPSITSEDPDAAALLRFCARHGITEVYLAISGDSLARPDLPRFVKRLRSAGLAVEALFGEPTWYRPARRRRLLDRIEAVALYNEAHPGARFTGIHLDIEPHQLPENKGAKNRGYLPALIEALAAARDAAAARGLSLSADVPRKLLRASRDEGEALMAACPRLVLMLYGVEQAAIIARARTALGWAASLNRGKVIVAVRAADVGEGATAVLDQVDAALSADPAYAGWALHDYAAFRDLGADRVQTRKGGPSWR